MSRSPGISSPSAVRAYVVQTGDTLDGIAAKEGVPAQSLLALNPPLGTPASGQVLKVPGIDSAGVSALTSTPSALYRPNDIAAAAPVWFHTLHNGKYIWINSVQWTAATPVAPSVYSSYTAVDGSFWSLLDPASQSYSRLPGYPVNMPLDTPYDSARVVACASRPPGYLFVLSSTLNNGVAGALLQHYLCASSGAVTPITEEVLPPTVASGGATVNWSGGVRLSPSAVFVFGSDATGNVYCMHKDWAKVGGTRQRWATQSFPEVIGGGSADWAYFNGSGYTANPSDMVPLKTSSGALTSAGPLSFATWRHHQLMTTVMQNGTAYSGQIWKSSQGLPWKPLGEPISLGSGSGYVGNGVQLIPHLQLNPSIYRQDPGTSAGIPYVYTTLTGASGSQSLSVAWSVAYV